MEAVAAGIEADAAPSAASVLLVAPAARGGLAHHVRLLLAGLHQDGYRVGVVSDPDGPIANAARERSLPVYPVAITSGIRPRGAMVAGFRVARVISRFDAQIVHTHSFGAGLVGSLAARLAGSAPLVATVHNYPPNAEGMRAAGRGHRWAIRQVVGRASRVITVSEALRKDLLDLHPEAAAKTAAIPNGVDVCAGPPRDANEVRRELGIPLEGPLVGMVARLAPQKGIEEFMRASRALADQRPGTHFVVVGEGPLREAAQALRDGLGLGDRVHLVGEVDCAADLTAVLDCLVVASTSEGSSLAAMEAMARGKPVVATRVGGVPEVVVDGETGILVEARDPDGLAAAIDSLLADPERAREMGERGRRRAVEHFNARLMIERIEGVYADLLRQRIETGGCQG